MENLKILILVTKIYLKIIKHTKIVHNIFQENTSKK